MYMYLNIFVLKDMYAYEICINPNFRRSRFRPYMGLAILTFVPLS